MAKGMMQDAMLGDTLATARAAYLAAVGALAEELRPRFASGELHALTEAEAEDYASTAEYRIERACGEALGVDEIPHGSVMMLLAVSPHAESIGGYGHRTARDWLEAAVTWDVIATARERGYYTPAEDESTDPLTVRACVNCGHTHNEGDGGCYCSCKGFRLAAGYVGAEVQP